MQGDFFAQKYDVASTAFIELLRSNETWLLSLVDSSEAYKSDILSRLARDHCVGIPFALLSLDLYTNDVGGLLTALIETPSINNLFPAGVKDSYEKRSNSALVDLSRTDLKMPSQTMESSPNGRQSINADVDKALRIFERYSENRIARSWVRMFGSLMGQRRLVFLLDDYESLSRRDRKYLLKILVSAHSRATGLRVVIASYDLMDMPRTLKSFDEVIAYRL